MAKAPRLQAFLERGYGPPVLIMSRESWDALRVTGSDLVEIDARQTPIADVVDDATRLAVVAHEYTPAIGRVTVYREDRTDPKPWNSDHYSVWDLAQHPDLAWMINRASTSLDTNLLTFLGEHVFWVKERPGPDHWLESHELPSVVRVLLEASG